ncbi:hypothetical protein AB7952_12130 [Streptomyces sp. PG2]
MTEGAGVLRSAASLRTAAERLERLRTEALTAFEEHGKTAEPGVDTWEATNLLCVARALVAAALLREETRGCHWREDHAERDDTAWRRHVVVTLTPGRTLAVRTTDTADFPPTLGPARAAGSPVTPEPQEQ